MHHFIIRGCHFIDDADATEDACCCWSQKRRGNESTGYLLWIADVCSFMTETMSLCVSGSTTTPLFSITAVRCALIHKISSCHSTLMCVGERVFYPSLDLKGIYSWCGCSVQLCHLSCWSGGSTCLVMSLCAVSRYHILCHYWKQESHRLCDGQLES